LVTIFLFSIGLHCPQLFYCPLPLFGQRCSF